jgi:hypothetical protein
VRDLAVAAGRPIFAGLIAAGVCIGFKQLAGESLSTVPRLLIGGCLLTGSYAVVLLYVMRQRVFYTDLLKSVLARPTPASSTAG